jgi:DMSO/TMAO reductase YedYZ molybdopterin-dependent catalytic subunit
MPSFDRRRFLQGASAALVATRLKSRLLADEPAIDKAAIDKVAASIVESKDPRLIVHTVAPPVLETPHSLLADHQVTPTPLFFVRNVQQPPQPSGSDPLASWQVELTGMINRGQSFAGKILRALPRTEVEMVVQCSGNGRELFAETVKTKGTQWGRGGMANVRFAGVKLSTVLEHLGVKPDSAALYLTAEGHDNPKSGESDFEHSLPLAETLEKSVLAYELNGEPLPLIHGGPLRLVTPGYYGTMQVKWVSRLRFEDRESDHKSHLPDYRTPIEPINPGDPFTPTYANSESNWRMRLKSVVLAPLPRAELATGKVTVRGVAFNDGEARIDYVLTSIDRGQSWHRATLDIPESPYAWYRWKADLHLPAGEQQIWARAVDKQGRTQPLDGSVFWNPQGYTWNGVEKITVRVAS